MARHSMYTPDGSFRYLLLVLLGTLVAAVVYLLAFTNATIP